MNMHHLLRRFPAHGISLIEVTFAIGVILIGLVGLTSILPLAGRRAQDSLDFDTAAALSTAVGNEIVARKYLREPAVVSNRPIASLEGAPLKDTSTGVIAPFCFDPILAANPPRLLSSSNSYDPKQFPYYKTNHNPMLDPAKAASTSTALANQPRMKRTGFNYVGFFAMPNAASLTGTARTTAFARQLELARSIAESPNDLNQLRPKDRSVPAVLTGLTASSTSTFFEGTRVPTGTYSWMVTVDPDINSQYASMAVVIMQSRERMAEFPDETDPADSTDPNSNALSERIALVTQRTGFKGGAGGSVTLVSSNSTVSSLTSGDWIMLSRNMEPGDTSGKSDVHAWYRVVAVDGDATIETSPADTTMTGPSGSVTIPLSALASGATIWSRSVLLDGPDWDFTTNASGNWLTYATLVKDVVTVNQQTISLADF